MSTQRTTSLARFKALTVALKQECLQAAHDELGAQAERLVGVMKSVVPVKSGVLRDSIGWTFGDPPKTRATGAFRPKSGGGNFSASVYAGNDKAFYARWVEFGTAPHSVRKGADLSRNKRQRGDAQQPGAVAQPFFWPSYRLLRKTMRSAVKQVLTKAIKARSAA